MVGLCQHFEIRNSAEKTLTDDCLTKLTKNNADAICPYIRADRCKNTAVCDESIICLVW